MKRTIHLTTILCLLAVLAGCRRAPEALHCSDMPMEPAFAEAPAMQAEEDTAAFDSAECGAVRRPDMTVRALKGDALLLTTEGLQLTALGGAVRHSGNYSVTMLTTGELPDLPQGMVNMTAAAAGYRLLPSGEHFSPAAELRVAYDPSLLPEGYTADDIHTSYYDETACAWVRLERIGIDTASHEIVSLTTHFTDFINELVKAPEMPETQAFVPTAMQDLEAVNPLDGLPLIQPPTANPEGTAVLNYPIWIPAGRCGMQPNLALTYSSGGGDGWLGVGWDLGVPSITLDTRWGVPRYSDDYETEIYMLGGEQLITRDGDGMPQPMPHRTNHQLQRMTGDIRFFARTGDAHDSIVRHGATTADYWWEVVDRTGVTHYYGHYPDATLNDGAHPATLTDADGHIARWALCESRDLHGNWVRYFYDTVMTGSRNPGRQLYLSRIEYTGYTGYVDNTLTSEDGVYSVVFGRRSNPYTDITTVCSLGFKETTDQHLHSVAVKYGSNIVTLYLFELENSAASAYKSRLRSVMKVDSCQGGLASLLNESMEDVRRVKDLFSTEQTFEYYDAPSGDTLFGEPVDISLDEGDVGLYHGTALGATRSQSWNAGGTLGVGKGVDVTQTTWSLAANYNYSHHGNRGEKTVVDLDGDGLPDLLYREDGSLYYCRQEMDANGDISFASAVKLKGAGEFLRESGHNNTIGLQGSLIDADGSVGWSWGKSYTSVYLADVNGDGLPDIVDDGDVLFNSLNEYGIPTFSSFLQQQEAALEDLDEDDDGTTVTTSATACGGIIFDGEIEDSIGCRRVWTRIRDTITDTTPSVMERLRGYEQTGHRVVLSATETEGVVHAEVYSKSWDCSPERGTEPATDAVRVWVAPHDGDVQISSKIVLQEDEGASRSLARHADGVTYSIQHTAGVVITGDSVMHANNNTTLWSTALCATCHDTARFTSTSVAVSAGDLLFFRLRSGNDRRFDKVFASQRVTYLGDNPERYDYDSNFLVSSAMHFVVPYNGRCLLDFTFNSANSTALTVHIGDAVRPYSALIDTVVAGGTAIAITVSPLQGMTPDWGQVSCAARLRYISDSLGGDTLTVWMPALMETGQNIAIWEKPFYRQLFGPLASGWGQFGYRGSGSLLNVDSLLAPSLLHSGMSRADSIAQQRRLNVQIDSATFATGSMEDFCAAVPGTATLLGLSSLWVEMVPDVQRMAWVTGDRMSASARHLMSNSWLERGTATTNALPGNSNGDDIIEYDDAVPVGTPKAIRKENSSNGLSWSVGLSIPLSLDTSVINRDLCPKLSFSHSLSLGGNTMEKDYLDLNGDRYPDIVTTSRVQYRSQWGGMGDEKALPDCLDADKSATTWSDGVAFGASPINVQRQASGNPRNAKFAISNDGSVADNNSVDRNAGTWMDVNGDGLPDYALADGGVHLNVGYTFLPAETWNGGSAREGVSATASVGRSPVVNISQGSIRISPSTGNSVANTISDATLQLADINGDGLPDRIRHHGVSTLQQLAVQGDTVTVEYNMGSGLWSPSQVVNIYDFNNSTSLTPSVDMGFTLGVTLMGLKVTGGVHGSVAEGVSRDNLQLADFDGDGLPDLVHSDGSDSLTLRRNTGGRTNLLRKVENFTGSRIWLEYTLSAPSYEQPSRSWQLTTVSTKDSLNPVGGDSAITRIEYDRPHYDRHERTFMGYGVVTTYQVDPADGSVYRSLRQEQHNENLLLRGRPRRELTCDGQGNKWLERVYDYDFLMPEGSTADSCEGRGIMQRHLTVTRHYEGQATPQLTTAERFEYDSYHNITTYYDDGDTAYADDGLRVEMTYPSTWQHNLIGLRSEYKIYQTGSNDWLRHVSYTYTTEGRLQTQTFWNGATPSVYEYSYDDYGNLSHVVMPIDANGQRSAYDYDYDNVAHTYTTGITDIFGLTTQTDYDLRRGLPTKVTDMTGSTIKYTYDATGRLATVRSPLDVATEPTVENIYVPVKYMHNVQVSSAVYPEMQHPYAVSRHRDDNGTLVTETAVIADGFGRIIQTKRGLTVEGLPKRQVSGRAETDAFGRTVRTFDPVVEDTTVAIGSYNDVIITATASVAEYDVLDRVTRTLRPLGVETYVAYDVKGDTLGRRRFRTRVTDDNGGITQQYTDYEGHTVQVTDAMGGATLFLFDPLGQMLQSTDPDGFATQYEYDLLGRLTERQHPDAGTTQYTYDAAGNMTQESTPLGNIFYDYTYNRLTKKRYSDMLENNVTYHYGTTGTAKGRVDSIADGTGRRALAYDALGNVVREERTLYVPGALARFFFVTQQTYDSWGRMRTLTYPDGEVVTYRYGYGGDLSSVSGAKGMEQHNYVTSVLYNAYGQRSRIDYGNGAYATYTYDALQRLSALTAVSASGAMQQISYTLDGLDNIVAVGNSATAIGSLGGTYQNLHIYDRLNRLTTSTGAGVCGNYTQDMEYSAAGRLAYKRTAGSVTGIQAVYGYCPDKPHAPRRIHDRTASVLHDLRWDAAGNLGQTSTADKGICLDSRFLFWTEDNRLHTVVDGTNHSYYAYDYAGERTLKMTGKCTLLDINAEWMTTMATLDDVTLYPSPYIVLTATGYTKHYYIGNERLCARIGGGGLASAVQISLQITNDDGLFARCNVQANTRRLELNNECCVQGLGDRDNQKLRERVMDIPLSLKSTVTADASSLTFMISSLMQVTALEDEAYFYHGDHLGGASWITDADGLPVQHLQYLPFGESYVNQRTGGYSERFRFTGKELDPETGYSYFDARYLESKRMTSFLSVDQYADRYPNRSPYVYCAWNPIKLIDPSGDTIILSKEAWVVQKEAFLSEFDRKEENIPFSYDEETMKMYYTEKNSGYSYSETQNEIIDHYKTLCENNYIVMVHVFDNNEVIKTTERTTTLGQEFAHGMTVHHSNNTADVYISKRPLLKKDGVVKNHPQTEAHQSIAILHEIGGHAFYHSQNIHGRENDRLTSEFENRCRDIFRGKYCFATKEIRQGRSSEIH